MALDDVLDITGKSSMHTAMYDIQMHRIKKLPNQIKYYKLKFTPFMFYYCQRVPNVSEFLKPAVCVYDHFRTTAPNDPNVTLNRSPKHIKCYQVKVTQFIFTSVTEY